MLDVNTAMRLGLRWTAAKGDEFGMYCTPGQGYKPYEGVTEPCRVYFEEGIYLDVPEFKLIKTPGEAPNLVLIGADALRAGNGGA